MRGSIQKKGDRYYARIEVGRHPATGRRRQKSLGGYRTKKEAQAAITKALAEIQKGEFVEPSKQTLSEFFDEWLVAVRSTGIKESSWDSYRSNIEAHIKPRIGGIRLRALQPSHLNGMYAELLTSGRRTGKGGLSPRTVELIHVTIHRALRDAVRWGHVARNVADLANRPKQQRPEMKAWPIEALQNFLTAVREDRLYPLYLMAATTGMRRGELLGLRWQDVDLEGGRISVRQTYVVVNYQPMFSTPKTKRSRRSIALDPATLDALRDLRRRQLEERMSMGAGYVESGLVFTRTDGSAIHPQSLSDAFERQVRGAHLPPIPFHALRHTYATVALSAGTHPKVVSERLGHSSISVTLDIYSHVIPALQEEAATQVASMILGGNA